MGVVYYRRVRDPFAIIQAQQFPLKLAHIDLLDAEIDQVPKNNNIQIGFLPSVFLSSSLISSL
jgi:hypothetical protein